MIQFNDHLFFQGWIYTNIESKYNFFAILIAILKLVLNLVILPFNRGNAVNSTSPPVRYLDDPWLFFGFFFNERLANGSIRSTNVPEDILTKYFNKRFFVFGTKRSNQ